MFCKAKIRQSNSLRNARELLWLIHFFRSSADEWIVNANARCRNRLKSIWHRRINVESLQFSTNDDLYHRDANHYHE